MQANLLPDYVALVHLTVVRAQCHLCLAWFARLGSFLHCAVTKAVHLDLSNFLDQMALRADRATQSGDYRESFRVVRLLRGSQPKVAKCVLKASGEKTQGQEEYDERWQ